MKDTPRILVVDDDTSWQKIYRTELTAKGYFVETAADLRSALEALNREFFHVAIVDLKLGIEEDNRDGLKVIERIWALDEKTLVIVGSGYADVSMYDEFRRMGIFSLTEIPAEARKAFQSIDFYQGKIEKGESLSNILEKVNKAIIETWPESTRKRWNTSPFSILKGISARETQRVLRSGPITELRPFLSSLVQPFFPWLQAKNKAMLIKHDHQTIAIESLCWSRASGAATLVRIGRSDNFQRALELAPIGSTQGVDKLVGKPLSHLESMHFEGAVYHLSGLDFYEFFEPPHLKKDANSQPLSN